MQKSLVKAAIQQWPNERTDKKRTSTALVEKKRINYVDAACATVWIGLSASVIMFNKYILSSQSFSFPITLTMIHMAFSASVAFVLIRVNMVESANLDFSVYIKAVVPVGVLFAGTLWFGNAAYVYLSVSFVQMLKALMPAAVYMVGCVFGTERTSRATMGIICVISGGVALASAGEINFVPTGVVLQLLSIVCESTRLTLVQILLQSRGLKLNPITTLYYVAPVSFAFLCVPWYFVESALIWSTHVSWPAPGMLLANAITALSLNVAVFVLIGRTSALTMNIAGIFKDWILIALSAAVFGSPVTALNIGGYFIAFGGVCWYNRHKAKPTPTQESCAGEKQDIEK